MGFELVARKVSAQRQRGDAQAPEHFVRPLNRADYYRLDHQGANRLLELFGGVYSLPEAAGFISERPAPRERAWSPGSLRNLIGLRDDEPAAEANHGLLFQGIDFLPNLTEPQVTKALAAALDAPTEPERRRERIMDFLVALGSPEEIRDGLFCDAAASYPRIEAEWNTRYCVEDGIERRRKQGALDLVLWGPNRDGAVPMVVVEAKFGHQVTDGQLENYTRWVERNTGSYSRVDKVILSVHGGRKEQNRSEGWRNVSWFSLIRRWEEQSSEDCTSLRLVKSIIWEKQKE